jgi:hypothetical protein
MIGKFYLGSRLHQRAVFLMTYSSIICVLLTACSYFKKKEQEREPEKSGKIQSSENKPNEPSQKPETD